MLRSFILGGLASLLLAGVALAQSAPVLLLADNTTAQSTNMTSVGSCAVGNIVTATVNNSNSRVNSTFTDSGSNTWAAGTEATITTFRTRMFTTTVAVGKAISPSTTFQYTLSSTGGASLLVECWPSSTVLDAATTENGVSSTATPISINTGTMTNASQTVFYVFWSNRWNSATPIPPTGWTTGNSILSGGTYGIRSFYANVGAGGSQNLALSGLSSTTWQAVSGGMNYTAVSLSKGQGGPGLLGCC